MTTFLRIHVSAVIAIALLFASVSSSGAETLVDSGLDNNHGNPIARKNIRGQHNNQDRNLLLFKEKCPCFDLEDLVEVRACVTIDKGFYKEVYGVSKCGATEHDLSGLDVIAQVGVNLPNFCCKLSVDATVDVSLTSLTKKASSLATFVDVSGLSLAEFNACASLLLDACVDFGEVCLH